MNELGNPMLPVNAPNAQTVALRQLFSILGGLSSNGPPLTPNAQGPQPQPQVSQLSSILGGLGAR